MVLGIKELWDSVSDAVVKIKDLFVGFIDIVSLMFSFLPAPFDKIMSYALIIISALIVVKIVRG